MFRLLIFFLFFSIQVFAQEESFDRIIESYTNKPIDRELVLDFNKETLELKHTGSFSKALQLNIWLLDKINKQDSVFLYAEVLHVRSRIYIDLGEYTKAIAVAKKALHKYIFLNDKPKIAALNNIVGVGYYFKSELDSTLYYYNKSFIQKKELKLEKWQLAISVNNIGIVYEDMAKYDEAIDLYTQAVNFLLEDTTSVNFLSDIYIALANTYKHKNNLVKALEFTTLALNEGLKKNGEDHPDMGFVYENNAAIYKALGDYKTAKQYIYKTLKINKKYFGNSHKWTAQSYGDLSEIMLKINKIDSALWAINKALSVEKRVNNDIDFGVLYQTKSHVFTAKADYKSALEYLRKSRSYFAKVYGKKSKAIASTWLEEAKIHLYLKDTLQVKKALVETFLSARYIHKNYKYLQAPFIVLEGKQIEFQIEENLNNKFKCINEQIDIIKYIKRFYNSSEAKLNFNTNISFILRKYFTFCFDQYLANGEEKYFDKAFELVQINTNSILAEELQTISQFRGTNEANEAFNKVKLLRQDWSKIKQDLYYEETKDNPSKKTIETLISQRVLLSRALDEAINKFDSLTTYLPQQLTTVSIREIQKKIDKKTQLIHYFIGDDNIYAFGITSEKYNLIKLTNSDKIENYIEKLRKEIVGQKSVNDVSNKLYQELIVPIVDPDKSEIIIIPNDMIGYIPFEILTDDEGRKLIQKFSISYNSAIGLLIKNSLEKKVFKDYWSGFGVTYSGIKDLPKSIVEINAISETTSGKRFINKEATIENFIKQAKNSEILHLALHGKVNVKNPLYSKLIFFNDSITSSQIYNEEIQSSLVVLSACETGYGTIQKGEGVMSLSRAFTFAGASSTLTSLWEVPDKETSQIMVSFYKHLSLGESKNKALQNAKLDYLFNVNDETLKHPYYWAGFVLTGETAPLITGTDINKIIFFSVLMALIFIIFWITFKRKRN
ncbi:MAG: CHAT domain-containing protein [Flavobacteriaceae bacterium]